MRMYGIKSLITGFVHKYKSATGFAFIEAPKHFGVYEAGICTMSQSRQPERIHYRFQIRHVSLNENKTGLVTVPHVQIDLALAPQKKSDKIPGFISLSSPP